MEKTRRVQERAEEQGSSHSWAGGGTGARQGVRGLLRDLTLAPLRSTETSTGITKCSILTSETELAQLEPGSSLLPCAVLSMREPLSIPVHALSLQPNFI